MSHFLSSLQRWSVTMVTAVNLPTAGVCVCVCQGSDEHKYSTGSAVIVVELVG